VYNQTSFAKSINLKEVTMKYILFLATVMLVMSACTTQYQATNYDDVYFSSKNQPPVTKHSMVVKTPETDVNAYNREEPAPAEANENQDTAYYAENQQNAADNNVNTDNGYNEDDYYDYAYSARLRRFHDPYHYNNYYNDYYTNSYWYDYDPWNFGTSIYMGYPWWGGWPSYSFGYNPWYMNPYNDWAFGGSGFGFGYGFGYGSFWNGFGYGGFWNGYNNGYWNGIYDGYYGNYYNSYDGNSHYYGHRGSVGNSGSIATTDNRTFGERYEARVGAGKSSEIRTNGTITPDRRGTSATQTRGETSVDDSKRGLARGTAVPQDARNGSKSTTATPTTRGENAGTNNNDARYNRPATTNQRPVNTSTQPQRKYQYYSPNRSNPNTNGQNRNNVNTGRTTQSYTSPEYNRPRSGQEYTSPKYRNTQPSGNQPDNNTRVAPPTNNNSQPDNRRYTQPTYDRPVPTRSNENYQAPRNNSNSQPSRSNENYQPPRNNSNSQPARSNTYSPPPRSSSPSPSRSNESYTPSRSTSTPSRSSESYTPSRSSSPSPSGNSSSGSSRSSSSGSSGNSSSGSDRRR
jgi:hypothetical protein